MTSATIEKRRRVPVVATLLCALLACLAVVAAPAAAEEGDSAPIRPLNEGGMFFRAITGPSAPEEYPFSVSLGEEQFLEQIDEHEVGVFYPGHLAAFSLKAEAAHDADGANVPTTIELTGEDVVTLVVHHRAWNPLAGGAPFVYPITGGTGWAGGFISERVEMNNPTPPPPAVPTGAVPDPCVVPPLHDLSLKTAKVRLRAAHCSVGQVHVPAGVTAGKAEVVKQFRVAGTKLAAGASVSVKLGPR